MWLLLTHSPCGLLLQLKNTQSWFKGYWFFTGIPTRRLGWRHMDASCNWIESRQPNLSRIRKTLYSETEQESLRLKTSQFQLVRKTQDSTCQSRLQAIRYWSMFIYWRWHDYLDLHQWLHYCCTINGLYWLFCEVNERRAWNIVLTDEGDIDTFLGNKITQINEQKFIKYLRLIW